MEILNIGPLELLLILVLAVIIFGPEDLVKYSRKAGRWIYRASKSDFWKSVVGTSKEIKEFPKQIMKEAEIEETLKEFNALNQSIQKPTLPKKDAAAIPADPDPPTDPSPVTEKKDELPPEDQTTPE
jgi:Sec-independent protein translocase protein TatA